MKKRKILFTIVPALLLITSCGGTSQEIQSDWPTISVDSDGTWIIDGKDTNVDSNGHKFEDIVSVETTNENGETIYVFHYADGSKATVSFEDKEETPEPEPEPEEPFVNELTAEVLDDVSDELKLSGHLTRSFNNIPDSKYALDVQVAYNSDAYYYASQSKDGSNDEMYLYKRAGKTERCTISLENKKVYEELQGVSWDEFRNPFIRLKSTDFIKSTQNPDIFNLNLEDSAIEDEAIAFLTSTTRYAFKGFDSFSVTMEKGSIIAIDVVTTPAISFTGYESYSIHLDVLAKNDEVEDINGPALYEKKPEHEKLGEALKELADNSLEYNYKIYDKSSDEENRDLNNPSVSQKIYISNDLYFYKDILNNVGGGYVMIDGDSYLVNYTNGIYTRSCYPYYDNEEPIDILSNFKKDFSVAVPDIFSVIDDKNFELNGPLAGVFGYYYDPYWSEEISYATRATIELDDEYHVKTITYSDNSTLYSEEFTKIGDFTYPFNVDQLLVGVDTFLPFVHTYSYIDEDDISHTIVIKDSENITIDGEKATNIFYNMRSSQVKFECNDYTYILSYTETSDEFSLTVKSTVYAYYELFYNDDLVID